MCRCVLVELPAGQRVPESVTILSGLFEQEVETIPGAESEMRELRAWSGTRLDSLGAAIIAMRERIEQDAEASLRQEEEMQRYLTEIMGLVRELREGTRRNGRT